MIVKQSSLKLKDFVIINYEYSFNPLGQEVNLTGLFDSYDIDLDFALQKKEEEIYHIYMRVFINYKITPEDGKKQGYSIMAESLSIFSFTTKLDHEEERKLLLGSGLSMSLNYLRSFLALTSGQYPLGKYLLPSIDMNDLMEKKQKMMKEKVSKVKKQTGK